MYKRVLTVLLALIMVVAVFAGCQSNATTEKTEQISVYVGSEPESIDPAFNEAVDGATLLIHAFEGLMSLDKDSKPILGQAEDYTVSDDGLTYTFTLRDDIKWSDGEPVTADDFIYAWKRAIDPANATSYGYMFDVIEGAGDIYADVEGASMEDFGAKALDEKTIEIKLIAPTPYFLELAAFPTYFPVRQDVVEANPDTWATDPATYVSNGPYTLETWNHDADMIYTKNENYYNVDTLGPEKIRFVLMSDANAVLAAFENNEILFADEMPNEEIDGYREKPEFHLEGQLGTYYLSFNTQKEPFDDANIRKALSLAIDRNFIVEEIGKAGQQPAAAFVPTGLTDADTTKEFRDIGGDYYSVDAADYEANVEEAKQLLADAGYPDGEGFPKFEYMYNPEAPGHALIGEALQNMWKEQLGIDCTLVSQEWNVFLQTRQDGNYQLARDGWLGDYNDPISFIDMFVSTSGNNNSQWDNAEYDAIVKQIKSSSDSEERYQLMHDAEDILMEEAPCAPIYYYVDIYLLNTTLEGFYSSPLGYKYFMYTSVAEAE
ncbi:MAG: peptide ABC transporter substrate-binding protein [Eubacteriales bacterium]